ncbi:2-desacetyl-2-hydroxyethyl bacteriochlorophyllide A dehydrogenase [Micromonospora echinospora]|uniref:2-desacetyl-2-hydroxyethyl bacteriochlorophyllide A dehydrogenase n=1 Tax=Micromonospora echinospora TaxID=1877 RepID=A0A1C4UC94_MICEC|nr:alcohol dehydrogenase catalytic domain-containing protein [Micromonospora echinospora]SCE69271.1 2-desacetyl-2-hydroxyethyl bacteriochlorophyllide A dehydrogenase [Micromonospora echinospora]
MPPADTVLAVRCHGPGDVRTERVPTRPPGPGEVAVAPLAVGVCGTDSHIVGGSFPAAYPVVLGHEVCGRVTEVGPDVDRLTPGDLVTVEPHDYCTTCVYCRLGQEHLCDHKRGYGVRLDGGMTGRMVLPARIAYRLPPDTPPWIGALTEPLACCVHGMDQLDPRSGLPVLIYGAGPAGAMMVALARSRGLAPIVVMDPRPDRRDLALRMGADAALDPGEPGSAEAARAHTDGLGFPYVVDAVGSARILESAVEMASRGGRILVFGVARPQDEARIRPNEIFARELTIVGAVINPYTHHRAVGLLPTLGLDRLRPAFYGVDEVTRALRAQGGGEADKVFIAPYGEEAARGGVRPARVATGR